MSVLAVLSFHKIGEPTGGWETWYYVSEEAFAGFLSILRQDGWEPIDAPRLISGLDDPSLLPDRGAVITFDDGYRSLLDGAVRCLERFEWPGIAFIPTGFLGGTNEFDRDVEPVEPICSAADLRELARRGISVQSHGVTHRTFSDLDADELSDEATRSRTVLQEVTGEPVELFAYPYGDAGAGSTTQDILRRAGYRAAFLYGGGLQPMPATDHFRLERIAMGPDTDLRTEIS